MHCVSWAVVMCELSSSVRTVWPVVMCELTWLICCGCTHDVLCHLQQSHKVSYGKLILPPYTHALPLVTMPSASQDPPVRSMLHGGSSSSTPAGVSVLHPPLPPVPSAHPPGGVAQPCGRTVTVCGSEWCHCLAISVSAISLARLRQWTKIYVVAIIVGTVSIL